jgi:hypothetical protein
MNREKLQQNPRPIDRVAYRVTQTASPEELWRPMPKSLPQGMVISSNALPVKPLDWATLNSNPALATLPGKRRDRMTIIGHAADQPGDDKPARWVVRCDCGNHEHRTKVLRWLGTNAPDMCVECRTRVYKLKGEWNQRDPATRATATAPQASPR